MARKAAAPKSALENKEEVPKVETKKSPEIKDGETYEVEGTGKNKHIKEGQKLNVQGLQAKLLIKKGAVVLK